MARGIRKKSSELLSKANIQKVIEGLNREKPISKKEACSILNISYNTTRLGRIIDDFIEREEYASKCRKEVAKLPLSDLEIRTICSSYLDGESLSDISDFTFRSIAKVKRILENYSIPLRDEQYSYFNPPLLKEEAIVEEYNKGDLVYSAKYSRACTIEALVSNNTTHGNIYKILFHGPDRFFAVQPYYELSDLRALQKLGVTLSDIPDIEIKETMREAFLKARKGKNK